MQSRDPAFRAGWNACSRGLYISENPYPVLPSIDPKNPDPKYAGWIGMGQFSKIIPGQSKYDLWTAGYAAYLESEYWCQALHTYREFKALDNLSTFKTWAEVAAFFESKCLPKEDSGGCVTMFGDFYFFDGSCISFDSSGKVAVISKKDEAFITLSLRAEDDTIGESDKETADGLPTAQAT